MHHLEDTAVLQRLLGNASDPHVGYTASILRHYRHYFHRELGHHLEDTAVLQRLLGNASDPHEEYRFPLEVEVEAALSGSARRKGNASDLHEEYMCLLVQQSSMMIL